VIELRRRRSSGRRLTVPGLLLAITALAAGGCGRLSAVDGGSHDNATAAAGGFVVWESNRSGRFRIWIRPLAGGEARRLSPDEPQRDHCCARISPDGARVAYLSVPIERRKYDPPTVPGVVHLVRLDDGVDRVVIERVRRQGGHRAIVWWSSSQLAYLDADGSTRLLDLALGSSSEVAAADGEESGWLVAPGGRWATRGEPSFSPRDPVSGRIRQATPLGGCEPTFSADGRIGLWVAGAGGPIDAIDTATRTVRPLLRKNDPRLPAGRRYLYFPALSADRTLLAWGASNGEHDHFRADYDIFVAEVDPRTIELTGRPDAVAPHPAVDRYPDVWRSPPTGELAGLPVVSDQGSAPASPLAGVPVWLWDSSTAANQRTPDSASEILNLHGEAWYDRRGRLALGGGWAAAREESAQRVAAALKRTNEVSLAILVEPASVEGAADGPLLALSRGVGDRGVVVWQRGANLELILRRGKPGAGGPAIRLATIGDAEPRYVGLTFSPGELTIYVDGERVRSEVVPGDFFFWRGFELTLGAESGSAARFRGWLSRLRVWDRAVTAGEMRRSAAEAREASRTRLQIPVRRVEARLLARSRLPTLDEISPYTQAMVVEEWELVTTLAGEPPPARFRVARWALLDSRPAVVAVTPLQSVARLRLEPFRDQPQLESVVVSDTLDRPALPLFCDVGTAGR